MSHFGVFFDFSPPTCRHEKGRVAQQRRWQHCVPVESLPEQEFREPYHGSTASAPHDIAQYVAAGRLRAGGRPRPAPSRGRPSITHFRRHGARGSTPDAAWRSSLSPVRFFCGYGEDMVRWTLLDGG
jgi:hypothetical protein